MPLHLVGISNNGIWHTIRRPGGWDPWENILASAGPLPSPSDDIACGFVNGQLHVCVSTHPAPQPGVFHTIRFARGNWQPWGDAGSLVFKQNLGNGRIMQIIGLGRVDCAGISNGLHLCIAGEKKLSQDPLNGPPTIWRSVRTPNNWTAPNTVTAGYSLMWDIACAKVNSDQLHVLARCQNAGGSELLIHNIWFADGTQQELGDEDVFSQFANVNDLRNTQWVAGAGIEQALHVVVSDGNELFHTIRLNHAAWQPSFGLVRPAVDNAFTGPLSQPACANDGGNLHVCAISAGSIKHTIRLTNPSAWRNPENATTGSFGDVVDSVRPGSTGSPTKTFSAIACAGE